MTSTQFFSRSVVRSYWAAIDRDGCIETSEDGHLVIHKKRVVVETIMRGVRDHEFHIVRLTGVVPFKRSRRKS